MIEKTIRVIAKFWKRIDKRLRLGETRMSVFCFFRNMEDAVRKRRKRKQI
ncbi:hypothetical protein LEP1GSC125_1621 [Leptospira mayottensis 200901122]|uniref:Uncharacterized protein n=1 Tax=Leptospira mayottensis 200901122 TaxID=1193010 RepID=A0AA87MP67_9LEPT|nr:hypothetical protein LEP1GSC125_1621 [Leptospira mayottensis 200901122]